MKPIFFVLNIIALFSVQAFAQADNLPAQIEWGAELNAPNNSYISKIITQDSEGYYVLRRQNRKGAFTQAEKIYIERYDNKNNLKRSEKIDLKYKKKARKFEDVLKLGGQLYMLSSYHNQSKKINYLFAERLTDRLRATGKLTKIGEIPTRNIQNDGFFDYHISKDSSKILVYNELPYKKGQPECFAFHVYDQQFDEIWSKDIVLPYDDSSFDVEEYQVSNDGNVHLLGFVNGGGNRLRRGGKPTYQYSILSYTNKGETFEEYPIQFSDYFITDLTFRVAKGGELVCAGFYSEKGTSSVKGTYFFRLNPQTKEIYNRKIKEFDLDFLTQDLSDRQKAKAMRADRAGDPSKEFELFRYSLDELVVRSDGGALLIAEQYYVEERFDNFNNRFGMGVGFNNAAMMNNNRVDYIYNYHDIIVVNINPKGEIDWATKIPKRQVTQNDGGYFSSYAHAIVRDKIYFIYNDNRRNFESHNRRNPYNFDGRSSIIALTELSQDGSTETFPLFINRDASILTIPKICKQTGRKEMTIYGERGKKYRFASLQFQ